MKWGKSVLQGSAVFNLWNEWSRFQACTESQRCRIEGATWALYMARHLWDLMGTHAHSHMHAHAHITHIYHTPAHTCTHHTRHMQHLTHVYTYIPTHTTHLTHTTHKHIYTQVHAHTNTPLTPINTHAHTPHTCLRRFCRKWQPCHPRRRLGRLL